MHSSANWYKDEGSENWSTPKSVTHEDLELTKTLQKQLRPVLRKQLNYQTSRAEDVRLNTLHGEEAKTQTANTAICQRDLEPPHYMTTRKVGAEIPDRVRRNGLDLLPSSTTKSMDDRLIDILPQRKGVDCFRQLRN